MKTSHHKSLLFEEYGFSLIVNFKDSYLVLEKLPAEYDSRVKAMEVDERPSEQYSDIGGCDKQIQVDILSHVKRMGY